MTIHPTISEKDTQKDTQRALKPDRPTTRGNEAMHPQIVGEEEFASPQLQELAYYSDENTLIFNMDAREAIKILVDHNILVNCIVTSPPFYGQRDYEVEGQIGLEPHPSQFISNLTMTFALCKELLVNNGSLWINIGDTYWSGKGEHRSGEAKQ